MRWLYKSIECTDLLLQGRITSGEDRHWRQIITLLWCRLGDDRLVHRVTEAQNWQPLQLHWLPRKVNRKSGYQSRTSTTVCVLLVANNNGLLPQSIKLIGQQRRRKTLFVTIKTLWQKPVDFSRNEIWPL